MELDFQSLEVFNYCGDHSDCEHIIMVVDANADVLRVTGDVHRSEHSVLLELREKVQTAVMTTVLKSYQLKVGICRMSKNHQVLKMTLNRGETKGLKQGLFLTGCLGHFSPELVRGTLSGFRISRIFPKTNSNYRLDTNPSGEKEPGLHTPLLTARASSYGAVVIACIVRGNTAYMVFSLWVSGSICFRHLTLFLFTETKHSHNLIVGMTNY
jgi:hypothetical protein